MGALDVPLSPEHKQTLCELVAIRKAGGRLTGVVGGDRVHLGQRGFYVEALEDIQDAGYLTLAPDGRAGMKITLNATVDEVCP